MSWVFLAGDRVYKLKKPVRFPYLDFSTLERREAACRAELSLNRRLAPDVYLDVVAADATAARASIGGVGRSSTGSSSCAGSTRARRSNMPSWRAASTVAARPARCRAGAVLSPRRPVFLSPAVHLRDWQQSLAFNRRVLLDPRFGLPCGLVRGSTRVQRGFLMPRAGMLARRVCIAATSSTGTATCAPSTSGSAIRSGSSTAWNSIRACARSIRSTRSRSSSLECERLGAAWAGDYIEAPVSAGLHDGLSEELFLFYRCHRATLRARLAIAHLLEPNPRTPEKWPRLARTYLRIAAADAVRLERLLRTPRGR